MLRLLRFPEAAALLPSTPPPYSPTVSPPSLPSFLRSYPLHRLAAVRSTSSGTRRIRGISYLAQIQSYEYNFPREQSFIVIVNPSVNCPALSITAAAVQLRSVPSRPLLLLPHLLYHLRPFSVVRRPRSLVVIHRGGAR